MIRKNSIRFFVFPALVSSIFTEVATNHHPDPHGNRSERMEQLTRRYQETSPASLRLIPPGSGGNVPDPIPTEETLSREARARRGRDLTV